jgi:hypothetical protein
MMTNRLCDVNQCSKMMSVIPISLISFPVWLGR